MYSGKVMLAVQELLSHQLQACWSLGWPFGFLLVVFISASGFLLVVFISASGKSLLQPPYFSLREGFAVNITEDTHFAQCTGTLQKAFKGRCGRGQRFALVRDTQSWRNFLNLAPNSAGFLFICWMPNNFSLMLKRSSNAWALYQGQQRPFTLQITFLHPPGALDPWAVPCLSAAGSPLATNLHDLWGKAWGGTLPAPLSQTSPFGQNRVLCWGWGYGVCMAQSEGRNGWTLFWSLHFLLTSLLPAGNLVSIRPAVWKTRVEFPLIW